jgi:regulatory protein
MDERKPKPLDSGALWNYALRILGGRAYALGEIREKLRRRAANEEDVDAALARLKELGYLDDRRFAESYAAARLSNDKFGRARVVRDLRARRVAPSLAESAAQRVYRGVDEQALIDEWIRRKYRATPREELFQEDKDLASAYRSLLRAGFRSNDVLAALKRFAKNPELLEILAPPDACADE